MVADLFGGGDAYIARYGVDALYTPSASRAASWYLAIGREWTRSDVGRGHGHFDAEVAEEIGLKFRFLAESQHFKNFLGGRIGLRASGTDPIHNARLVFEFGAGSW